jgi:hypothetical protein
MRKIDRETRGEQTMSVRYYAPAIGSIRLSD